MNDLERYEICVAFSCQCFSQRSTVSFIKHTRDAIKSICLNFRFQPFKAFKSFSQKWFPSACMKLSSLELLFWRYKIPWLTWPWIVYLYRKIPSETNLSGQQGTEVDALLPYSCFSSCHCYWPQILKRKVNLKNCVSWLAHTIACRCVVSSSYLIHSSTRIYQVLWCCMGEQKGKQKRFGKWYR